MSEAGHHKDYQGAKLGMWLFLFTELLLFGGLFILYWVYLNRYPVEFVEGGNQLNVLFGGGNTVVLLTSSLTVAVGISALQKGNKKLCLGMLGVTIAAALLFLLNKYFEWSVKIGHGIYPGSPHLREMPHGESVFFGLYFITTGLHGIHVLLGAGILTWVALLVRSNKVNQNDFVTLENAGLYWHLVDLVWIFLYPLLYLV
jgi:cytochrome c oxidase subunit 3